MLKGICALVVLALACKSKEPPPSPAPAVVSTAPSNDEALSRQARERLNELFAAYDALPADKKSTQGLIALKQAADEAFATVPAARKAEVNAVFGPAYRARMAPLIRPKTRAAGEGNATLVPSPKEAECRLWGAMWSEDEETLQSLLFLGFERMVCGHKAWDLHVEAARCYLYWDGSEPDHEADGVVFIWKDEARYQRQLIEGKRRGDDATMRYLALVSEGAAMVTSGGTFAIVARGDGWLQVRGTGEREGQDGIVDARACHRRKRRP